MATPLYPTFEKRITDAVDAILVAQVTPWSHLAAGSPLRVKRFDGREIAYQNVKFDGTPSDVFWSGYIEPFLKDMIVRELAAAVESCRENEIDARIALPELQELLLAGCGRVFSRMAEIDRTLRSRGSHDPGSLRPIDQEVRLMEAYLQSHTNAKIAMWKQGRLRRYAQNNPLLFPSLTLFLGVVTGIIVPLYISNRQKGSEKPQPIEIKLVPLPTATPEASKGLRSQERDRDPLRAAVEEFYSYNSIHPEVVVGIEKADDPDYNGIWTVKVGMLKSIEGLAKSLHREKEVESLMELKSVISDGSKAGPLIGKPTRKRHSTQ